MLILEKSPLRLSEGAFLNDSSEGTVLFEFIQLPGTPQAVSKVQTTTFAKRPFIGSYVPQDMHDDLTLWRMYGKEERVEATGCSITVNAEKLLERIKEKLVTERRLPAGENIDEDLQFYRVAYKENEDKSTFLVPKADTETQTKLNELLGSLKQQTIAYYEDVNKKERGRVLVLEQLNSIAYLFKDASYRHEQELRLVIKGLRFAKNIEKKVSPPWVYIELADIVPVIRKITIGPKVDKKEEWASAFYYTIKNDPDRKEEELEINISHLPFK